MTYYKIFSLPTSSFLEAAKAFDTFYKDHMANIDLFLTSTDPEMAAMAPEMAKASVTDIIATLEEISPSVLGSIITLFLHTLYFNTGSNQDDLFCRQLLKMTYYDWPLSLKDEFPEILKRIYHPDFPDPLRESLLRPLGDAMRRYCRDAKIMSTPDIEFCKAGYQFSKELDYFLIKHPNTLHSQQLVEALNDFEDFIDMTPPPLIVRLTGSSQEMGQITEQVALDTSIPLLALIQLQLSPEHILKIQTAHGLAGPFSLSAALLCELNLLTNRLKPQPHPSRATRLETIQEVDEFDTLRITLEADLPSVRLPQETIQFLLSKLGIFTLKSNGQIAAISSFKVSESEFQIALGAPNSCILVFGDTPTLTRVSAFSVSLLPETIVMPILGMLSAIEPAFRWFTDHIESTDFSELPHYRPQLKTLYQATLTIRARHPESPLATALDTLLTHYMFPKLGIEDDPFRSHDLTSVTLFTLFHSLSSKNNEAYHAYCLLVLESVANWAIQLPSPPLFKISRDGAMSALDLICSHNTHRIKALIPDLFNWILGINDPKLACQMAFKMFSTPHFSQETLKVSACFLMEVLHDYPKYRSGELKEFIKTHSSKLRQLIKSEAKHLETFQAFSSWALQMNVLFENKSILGQGLEVDVPPDGDCLFNGILQSVALKAPEHQAPELVGKTQAELRTLTRTLMEGVIQQFDVEPSLLPQEAATLLSRADLDVQQVMMNLNREIAQVLLNSVNPICERQTPFKPDIHEFADQMDLPTVIFEFQRLFGPLLNLDYSFYQSHFADNIFEEATLETLISDATIRALVGQPLITKFNEISIFRGFSDPAERNQVNFHPSHILASFLSEFLSDADVITGPLHRIFQMAYASDLMLSIPMYKPIILQNSADLFAGAPNRFDLTGPQTVSNVVDILFEGAPQGYNYEPLKAQLRSVFSIGFFNPHTEIREMVIYGDSMRIWLNDLLMSKWGAQPEITLLSQLFMIEAGTQDKDQNLIFGNTVLIPEGDQAQAQSIFDNPRLIHLLHNGNHYSVFQHTVLPPFDDSIFRQMDQWTVAI